MRTNRALALLAGVVLAGTLAAPATALAAGSKTMYRFYNQWTGEHLYTADATEAEQLPKQGWKAEGKAWTAPEKSSTPVYRLYNPYVDGGDHHYTMEKNEYESLKKAGWKGEGVAWYSDDEKGVPLYRLYNPYSKTGTHHYTTSAAERDALMDAKWLYEGRAWYGVKESSDEVSGATDEEVIHNIVATTLDKLKELDDATVEELVTDMSLDGFEELGVTPEAFVRALLSGFDYKIDSVKVSGAKGSATVTVTCKSVKVIEKDLSAALEGATIDDAGKIIIDTITSSATHKDSFTFTFTKSGNTWTCQNASEFFNDVFEVA